MLDKKKLTIAALFPIIIALLFWSQSRLPQLNEKAQMAERTSISAIAFDVIYPVDGEESYFIRVAKTSVNWAYTNWKGMTFGLLFAAAFLTVLVLLPQWRTSTNPFINSLKGLLAGVPLGVCVNCTTPIAYGMHRANINEVTVLSTLMSSPTLNVIVLSMAFALLPLHLAAIKMASALVFILLILPVVTRKLLKGSTRAERNLNPVRVLSEQLSNASDKTNDTDSNCELPVISQTWHHALISTLVQFGKHLFFIIKMTLPLMLLAGLLGAMLIEIVPFTELRGLESDLFSLLIVAVIGTLLPVPIAFDVVVVTTLLMLGMPTGLAMALLFSLAIYSIYPALIIGRNISKFLSFGLFASVVLSSVVVGSLSQYLDDYVRQSSATQLAQELGHKSGNTALSIAIENCDSLNLNNQKQACLTKFLATDYAKNILVPTCDTYLLDRPELHKTCVSNVKYQQVFAQTQGSKDIMHCLTLDDANLQAKCWQAYTIHRAIKPEAIDWCNTITEHTGKEQCRVGVMLFRVARMQNYQACDVNLPGTERKGCKAHVDAIVTSLGGDLKACEGLPDIHQIKSCKKNIYQREIDDEQNYQFCESLTDQGMTAQCQDYVSYRRAEHLGERLYCKDINNFSVKQKCYINATVHSAENQISHQLPLLSQNSQNSLELSQSEIVKLESDGLVEQAELLPSIAAPALAWNTIKSTPELTIQFVEHVKQPPQDTKTFKSIPGPELGLSNPVAFSYSDFIEPFSYGRGMSSGDFNNDGWPDLAFATPEGATIYQNLGQGKFTKYQIIKPTNQQTSALLVTFVDINNDGWQDLFLSTYGGTNHFYLNTNGRFSPTNAITEEQLDRIATMAAGFADWDKDGDLDYVAGNWSYGDMGSFNPQYSHNHWLTNMGDHFSVTTPNELQGDTLSVLLSDFNQDNNVDLMVGNDREYPDQYYLGDSHGHWRRTINTNDAPITSFNTMGIITADFNNDLNFDLFSTDMSFAIGHDKNYCELLPDINDRAKCKNLISGYKGILDYDVTQCIKLANSSQKQDCLVALAIQMANRDQNMAYCRQIPTSYVTEGLLCNNLASRSFNKPMVEQHDNIIQHQQNMLLIRNTDGSLSEKAAEFGVDKSFWSWNAKAADLDNDEWQDLYVGNGYEFGTANNEIHSNVFFHNQMGKGFKQAEKEFGLTDYVNTTNYSYADIDLDGDLDIIANGTMSAPRVFLNQNQNNSITFSLRDDIGNHFCIGCKATIYYGDNKRQIRELLLSGGFQSFDEPVIHFGLASYEQINRIDINWSTGETTTISEPLKANRRYRIYRNSNVRNIAAR